MKNIRIFWNMNPEPGVSYRVTINGGEHGVTGDTQIIVPMNYGEHVVVSVVATASGMSDSQAALLEFDVPVDCPQLSAPTGLGWEAIN